MKGFSGFPKSGRMVKIPALFFSELLPHIDHLAELKVTLYCFWRLQFKKEKWPYLSLSELLSDRVLLAGLDVRDDEQRLTLRDGLERAVARGTLLRVTITGSRGEEPIFFLNTPLGREAIQALERGEWQPDIPIGEPLDLTIERPNIFTVYEQHIGPLTPHIAQILREAEATYPEAWIEEAIDIAVQQNVRKWAYIEAILKRWQAEGKTPKPEEGDEEGWRRYISGKYSDFIEH
jgi:DNA replication protein